MLTQRPFLSLPIRLLFLAACAGFLPSAPAWAAVDSGLPDRSAREGAPVETSMRTEVLSEFPARLILTPETFVPPLQPPALPSSPPSAPSLEPVMQPRPARTLAPVPSQEIRDELPRIKPIDLTTPPDDLWQRVRNGFAMANLDSPLVAERQAWYLNRPELLRNTFNRSRRYLYFIVGELEKRGMPTELALLPIVESAYNPMALSPARASGIWQFIPSTGKNYRLEQNWWIDQRRDIIASTGAALDYLQALYEMQGDWHLALASYNWGENAVARAIAKNQAKRLPTDYAHINMPNETRYYVPKLQALKNILAQPQLFGAAIDPIPNKPYFDTVDKTTNMDVSTAARLAEMPLDEFLALNPSYNRPVMPANKGSQLVLPAGKVQTFLNNLQQHEEQEKPLSNWRTHTLKKGEKLDKVAARFGLTAINLRQINGITARTRIGPGTTLLVPNRHGDTDADLADTNMPETADATTAKNTRTRNKGKAHRAAAAHGKAGKHEHASTRKNVSHGSKAKTTRHAASSGKHKKR